MRNVHNNGKRQLMLNIVFGLAGAIAALILIRAFQSRSLPDLQIWHTYRFVNEFSARTARDAFSFQDYQILEESLFEELDREIVEPSSGPDADLINRYNRNGIVFPGMNGRDWNRSFELVPDTLLGGVLLLHGLTDSPYTVRGIAETFRSQGFHVVAPRLPGHGTTPGGLKDVTWKDMMAIVHVGMKRVEEVTGNDRPIFIGGYSTGG